MTREEFQSINRLLSSGYELHATTAMEIANRLLKQCISQMDELEKLREDNHQIRNKLHQAVGQWPEGEA
jgi:hypothetical protein